jgi:hypothetical protein
LETIQSAKNPITGEDEKLSQEDLMTLSVIEKGEKRRRSGIQAINGFGLWNAHATNRTYGRTTDIHGHKLRHGID